MEPKNVANVAWEELALRAQPPATPSPPKPAAKAPPRATAQPGALPPSYLTHELRAPVTAIRLGLEMLNEQVCDRLAPDEKQMLGMAVRNTTRLEGLVNDIMDFSKAMAGKLTLQRQPCDPRALADEAVDCLRATALSQGIKLLREPSEPLPRISAESRRVVQVLVNLIANALKFTPARGTVSVSAQKGKREHQGTIVFKVKDTGRGIPAKDLDRIFETFAQSCDAKAGTGLGLTISRMMVELHGGRIWAESWRQLGSTFSFTIPIAAEDLGPKIEVYPKPVQIASLLVSLARRVNAFVALFV